jgi:hypothetical protein
MIKHLTILVVVLLTASSCSDDDPIQSENFVGEWTVTRVDLDGTLMTEWIGSHLTIEQNNVDRGLYSMDDTKYDSIWSSNGTWTKQMEQQELIFDDTLRVNIFADHKKMTIIKLLPWTGQSTCQGDICSPDVPGYWTFEFERDQ